MGKKKKTRHKGRTITLFRDNKGIVVREGTLLFEVAKDRNAALAALNRATDQLTPLRKQIESQQKEIAILDKLTMAQLETAVNLQHLLILRTANPD